MPRNYLRISSRATYSKDSLEIAVQKIRNKELTYAAASKIYGIPKSTLSDRVLKKTAITSHTLGRPTAIPIILEQRLANCLGTMEKWGWGLSREEVLDITQDFIKRNNIHTPFNEDRPGPDWFISFRQRHNLSIKKPQPVEYLRKKMTDPFIINEYFSLLEKTLNELDLFDPKRIWNLDETSVCLDPTKTKVVGARGEPCTRTTCGTAKENITVLTTVNAAGQKLNPLIVFKGKHMYEQWMLDNPEKYDFELAYAASKRGWMETEIFYNYMSKIIIPSLGELRPVLLLYDGHVSHIDDKVVALAVKNNITILKFPAHTSHLLQPLDLAVFKSFKTIWDKNLVKWQRQNVGIKLRKQCFAKMFAEAWQQTKPRIIQNGFKKSGIYPFNPAVIEKHRYNPAAYERWQKHNATHNLPKSLKLLCIEFINRLNKINDKILKNKKNQIITTSFENLLLEKVSQHPENTKNSTVFKLKRIARGAEVITKSFVEKQQAIELMKGKDKQKITKQKSKTVLQSKNNTADPIPGPSGIQGTIKEVPILTSKNSSKKAKGLGKKSRSNKENKLNVNKIHNIKNKYGKNKKTKKPMKRDKRNNSNDTSIESVQMSIHSDSDLLDSLSDILSDCDKWTDFNYSEKKTDLELSREEQIEQIVKEIHAIDNNIDRIANQRDRYAWQESGIEKIDNAKQKNENNNKVTILSNVKFTPDNQAFYKTHPSLQLRQFDKDENLLEHQKRKLSSDTNISNIPKKKPKKVNCSANNTVKCQKDQTIDKDDVLKDKSYDDIDIIYKIGDIVLVKYFKRNWRYYVGVVESINEHSNLFTITFYKTIGKKNYLKFVISKRKDQDCVPNSNIVKIIELLQINENPVEYTLKNENDRKFF